MRYTAHKDDGFTLLELMVVVLILGILVCIAVPMFQDARARAATNSCISNQRTIAVACTGFFAEADGNLQSSQAIFAAETTPLPLATTIATLQSANGSGDQLVGSFLLHMPRCPGDTGATPVGYDVFMWPGCTCVYVVCMYDTEVHGERIYATLPYVGTSTGSIISEVDVGADAVADGEGNTNNGNRGINGHHHYGGNSGNGVGNYPPDEATQTATP